MMGAKMAAEPPPTIQFSWDMIWVPTYENSSSFFCILYNEDYRIHFP